MRKAFTNLFLNLLLFLSLYIDFIRATRIAEIYNKLDNTTSKLHKSGPSIGLKKKAPYHKVTQKFAQISGQFINKQDQIDAERKLMLSHLNRHVLTLKELSHKLSQLDKNLLEQVCQVRFKSLKKRLLNISYRERVESFKTKNRKLATLIAKQDDSYKSSTYSTLLINLSSNELTSDEINQFKFGLHYSFVDKNKNIKKHLAANFESLADKITENLDSHKREDFHEFLRAYVDIFTKNVYATTDYTYKHLKRIIKDPNLAVVSGDKESCVVIMNKSDYQNKMQQRINDGIRDGIYKVTVDNTLDDLKTFKRFLYRKFLWEVRTL